MKSKYSLEVNNFAKKKNQYQIISWMMLNDWVKMKKYEKSQKIIYRTSPYVKLSTVFDMLFNVWI